jgi:sugar phosphate permease
LFVVALAIPTLGTGAALSQTIAGSIVHRLGYHAGFLFLAAVAAAALAILYFFMPETLRSGK